MNHLNNDETESTIAAIVTGVGWELVGRQKKITQRAKRRLGWNGSEEDFGNKVVVHSERGPPRPLDAIYLPRLVVFSVVFFLCLLFSFIMVISLLILYSAL